MSNNPLFDGRRFVDVAERLQQDFDDEAIARAAIGRCYYAVFLPAREACRSLQGVRIVDGGTDHETVKQNYWHVDRNGARDFRILQDWRRKADYTLSWSADVDIESMADKAIDVALKLLGGQANTHP